MKRINKKIVNDMTGDYDEWLDEHLQDVENACSYVQVAMDLYQEDHDKGAFLLALRTVAQAQGGIAWLAEQTELNREHLYYLLSGKGNLRLDTLTLIFQALGMRLQVVPG